jgi:hypothetical protein
MLRNSTSNRNIDIMKLLTSETPKTQQALFRYVTETGHFYNTFGEIPMLKETTRRKGKV